MLSRCRRRFASPDRIAAEIEEIIVDADLLKAQASVQSLARCASTGSRGATKGPARRGRSVLGDGKVLRSTLPLAASGKVSRNTNAAGIMYCGRRSAKNCRKALTVGALDTLLDCRLYRRRGNARRWRSRGCRRRLRTRPGALAVRVRFHVAQCDNREF